jgi:hypothetical protein
VTVLASLLNPETLGVYSYVWQLQTDVSSQVFVTEWQPPDIRNPEHIATFFAPLFIVIVGLIYGRRPNLTELLFFLVFTIFGLMSSRNAIWFVLVSTPILAWSSVDAPVPTVRSAGRRSLNFAVIATVIVATLLLSPWIRPGLGLPRLRPYLVEPGTPVEAADFVAAQDLRGRIFHPQEYGDYLIWRLWPQHQVFFDGRVHLYSSDFVRRYFRIIAAENWEEELAGFGVEHIMLPAMDPKYEALLTAASSSSDWRKSYDDGAAVIFSRAQD